MRVVAGSQLLTVGQRIRDTYEVDRYLGEGAFAEVYRVQHSFLGKQAMKVFKAPGLSVDEVRGWLDEAVLLSKLGHPNIIRVFDANTFAIRGRTYGYFTMEYVAGGSLDRFWQSHRNRYIPLTTALEIFKQACRGAAVAHAESPPVVHRDIKPHNILIGYDKEGLIVRLSDFGLAKSVNQLTLLASTKGTFLFKSPEALIDLQQDSTAGDVWALGTTMYLILTDRVPYPPRKGESVHSSKRFRTDLVPASYYNYQVSKELDRVLCKSLCCDPQRRYPDALSLLEELEKLSEDSRPERVKKTKETMIDSSKSALGIYTPADGQEAQRKAQRAIELAKQASKLHEAADLMEEAINQWPTLKDEYQYRLILWRKGLLM